MQPRTFWSASGRAPFFRRLGRRAVPERDTGGGDLASASAYPEPQRYGMRSRGLLPAKSNSRRCYWQNIMRQGQAKRTRCIHT